MDSVAITVRITYDVLSFDFDDHTKGEGVLLPMIIEEIWTNKRQEPSHSGGSARWG